MSNRRAAVPVRESRLSNGLTILTRELHNAPIASFWVWYRVGARNEVSGITGISHWVEHMLFKGTAAYKPGDIFRAVTRNGGTLNGFTWVDYTTYYETLPSDRLDLALDIESDRMVNALFNPDEVASERTVIIAEREGHENNPTFHLDEEVTSTAFKVHPYGNGVIGWKCDLQTMTREDLYAHYQRYYVPGNAVVVAVGDFNTDDLLRRIEDRFGGIPAGAPVPHVRSIEPIQEGERRVHLRRPAPTSYLQVAYQAPNASDADAFPMMVLDAILSGAKSMGMMGGRAPMGRSARLYKALVDPGLATSARTSFALTRDPFAVDLSITLRQGVALAEVERIAFETIDSLASSGPTADEMARVLKQVRAQFSYGTETITSQAYWLGSLATIAQHTLLDQFIDRIASVTADDVRNVASRYLNERRRTVGWLEPTEDGGGTPVDSRPAVARCGEYARGPFFVTGGRDLFAANRPVTDGLFAELLPIGDLDGAGASPNQLADHRPSRAFSAGAGSSGQTQPALPIDREVLSNGLVLLAHANPISDAVVLRALIRTGAMHDRPGRAGTARLTSSMLQRGSLKHTFEELNEMTDREGISISSDTGMQTTGVTVKCLREDLPRAVEILAELIREPIFPAEQLEKVRGELLTGLREADQDTRSVAERSFREAAYPESHPYRRRVAGYVESVPLIERSDLVENHRATFRPDLSMIAVSGGVDITEAFTLIKVVFDDWQSTESTPVLDMPEAPPLTETRRIDVALVGKTQADIVLGIPSLPRNHPDYYSLDVANLILGRLGLNGRIGANVRERQGLAYYSYSSLEGGQGPGAWAARAGVNPANVDSAIEAIVSEIRTIRENLVTVEELDDAQSYLTGVLPLALESNDSVAGNMLSIELYGLGLDYIDRYPGIIRSLTREHLLAAAQQHLSADAYALVVVGPGL